MHFFGFFLPGRAGHRTALIASSKTVFKPFCVRAEHSRYFTAAISFAIWRPWGYVIGDSFFSFSFSMVSLSSRKSNLVPTSTIGVFGQWWLTSGYHCKLNTNKYSWTKFEAFLAQPLLNIRFMLRKLKPLILCLLLFKFG